MAGPARGRKFLTWPFFAPAPARKGVKGGGQRQSRERTMTPPTPGSADQGGCEADVTNQEIRWLRARVRYLEERLARYEPRQRLRSDEWLDGPQRVLSAEEIRQAVERLLPVCAKNGVEAVLEEQVCTCRELLLALADACHRAGLTAAG